MFLDDKKNAAAIVAKIAPPPEGDDEAESGAPEGLKAATEEIMAALGQDYGSGPNADRGQQEAFEDKRDRLCDALCAFMDQYRSGE